MGLTYDLRTTLVTMLSTLDISLLVAPSGIEPATAV